MFEKGYFLTRLSKDRGLILGHCRKAPATHAAQRRAEGSRLAPVAHANDVWTGSRHGVYRVEALLFSVVAMS